MRHPALHRSGIVALLLPFLLLLAVSAQAQEALPLSSGQTLYLPIYSHIYHGSRDSQGQPSQALTSAHISIRNTDGANAIRIHSARYFDTRGRLLKEYLTTPQTLPPLGSHELFVPHEDTAGGSGASFVIVWSADTPANPPLVEALHADIRSSRAVVFITSARPVKPRQGL